MSRRKRPQGNPAARPRYRGLPVPWVVRRVNERPPEAIRGSRLERAAGADGRAQWRLEAPGLHRDEHGFLWYPDAPHGRDEQPEFSQVHPTRHRRCMDERRCQVCSARMAQDTCTWLVDQDWLAQASVLTPHAPVCERCAPVAQRYCPFLRAADWVLATAATVQPAGVLGDVVAIDGAGRFEHRGVVLIGDERAPRTLARQRLMRLSGLSAVADGRA